MPDRTADTLATWLQHHPGVEVISRDRAEASAEGATRGAPSAVQVADRFHLVKNLGDALLQVLTLHRTTLAQVPRPAPPAEEAATTTTVPAAPTPWATVVPSPRADPVRRAQRLMRYEQVVALRTQGWTQAAIAREVGVSQRTILRWLAVGAFPERKPRRRPPNPFAPDAEYLTRRWGEGCQGATQLWREVCAQGYHGPRYRIWEVMQHLRRGASAVPAPEDDAPSAPVTDRSRTPRRIVGIVLRRAEQRSTAEQELLAVVRTACPEVQRACTLAEQFRTLVRERTPENLMPWLTEVASCGLTDLERLATGLQRDIEAVQAALTLPYSNGQTEGQITRLKLIKRRMYGRAKLDLLEHRVLYRSVS